MIEIDDLDGSGKMQVGHIPDPDGSVSENHFEHGPLPTSEPSFRVDAKTERLRGLDGSHVGGGIRVADGHPSWSTRVCVHTQPSLHSRVRARWPSILPLRPSVSAATTGTWMPSISTYISGIFCFKTTGRTSCLARPISRSSR